MSTTIIKWSCNKTSSILIYLLPFSARAWHTNLEKCFSYLAWDICLLTLQPFDTYWILYIYIYCAGCILQRCMPDNDVYLNHLLGRYGNDNLRFWVTSYFRRTSLILLYADNLLYTMHARNCNLIYFYIKLQCLIYDK